MSIDSLRTNVYQTRPTISESEIPDFDPSLYRDYLQGRNCDCELISREGHIIKMHTSVLRKQAEWLLESNTIPSEKLAISINDYDSHTIRAFVEFLYLDYDKFLGKYGKPGSKYEMTSCTIPIFALLDFAHKYNQLYLFGCCVDIIRRVTDKMDANNVLAASRKYGNYFLWLHYQNLINQ